MYESKLEKISLAETFNKLISRTNHPPSVDNFGVTFHKNKIKL